MTEWNPKERLIRVLEKEEVDRPPVICPGGMMNAAIVDVMERSGCTLPEAHSDAEKMANLALAVAEYTGFENLGIPFCLTAEAEVLGSEVTLGNISCEPKITKEIFGRCSDVETRDIKPLLGEGRIPAIVGAARILADRFPETPVIGNLTGPISTAASLVDPMNFFKDMRRDKESAHRVLEYVSDFLIAFAKAQVAAGATLISIADPTATGEILGPKMFAEYAVPYLNRLIDGIHETGAPVILHICGRLSSVDAQLPGMHSEAISTDALVNLKKLKSDYPTLTTMGNVSTYLLEFQPPEQAARSARSLVDDGTDIIAPACGLSTSTKLASIQAMTGAVRERTQEVYSMVL